MRNKEDTLVGVAAGEKKQSVCETQHCGRPTAPPDAVAAGEKKQSVCEQVRTESLLMGTTSRRVNERRVYASKFSPVAEAFRKRRSGQMNAECMRVPLRRSSTFNAAVAAGK